MREIKTADEFFALASPPVEPVEIDEWDCTLYIRDLSGMEAEHIGRLRADNKPVLAWLLKYSVCDANGKDLFATIASAESACKKSAKGLNGLIEAINRRNWLGGSPGNSPGSPSEDSPSV